MSAVGPLLDHDNSNLRKEVAAALGEIGHPSALPHLQKHVDDPDPDVRKNVRWAIGRLREALNARSEMAAMNDAAECSTDKPRLMSVPRMHRRRPRPNRLHHLPASPVRRSKYIRIRDWLMDRILSFDLKRGDKLPSENDLVRAV